jgi:hypothetical protein
MLDHTPEAARGVLRGLFGWAEDQDELIEVSTRSPRGRWKSWQWRASVLFAPETIQHLAHGSEEGREIYMGCVGLVEKPDKSWRRGGTALRGHAGALWLDVDCQAPGREGSEFFTGVDKAVENVDRALGAELSAASLVIGSGWGVQYWIPLAKPVPGTDASRLVRVMVGFVGAATEKKIDRVWDVTRVMRMPGTLNWRAGDDTETAHWAGVLRWPDRRYAGGSRLELGNVTDLLVDRVTAVLGPGVSDVTAHVDQVEALLARFYPGTETETASGSGGWEAVEGDVLGDLDRMAETLSWADVLEPFGWRCVSGGLVGAGSEREQVWERPGKPEVSTGEPRERSAVVYADKPGLLVVYSDSPACGFSAGLRGSGRRGDGAGVGVISRWRAYVDLAFGGNGRAAADAVRDGVATDAVLERLGRSWETEMGWVEEWGREREWEALYRPTRAHP